MKIAILMAMVWLSIPMTGFSTCNYPCEIDNPDESQRWAVPCVDAPEGTTITNEPCKECDGAGQIRHKANGTEVEVAGVSGRCCDGIWYAIDQAKEDDECWEWDEYTCSYVELPKKCWRLITVPPAQNDDQVCPDCYSILSPTYTCGYKKEFRTVKKAIPACKGQAGFQKVWTYDQIDRFCKGELDECGMMRFLLNDFANVVNDPCVSAAVSGYVALYGGMCDGSQLASLIDDIINCLGGANDLLEELIAALMDPWTAINNLASWHSYFANKPGWICDFIVCVEDPLALPRRHKFMEDRLIGDKCP